MMIPCCNTGCGKPATKEIFFPPFRECDNTLMCDEHAPEWEEAGTQIHDFKQPDVQKEESQ